MMRSTIAGIEVGSARTRVVYGEFVKGEKTPKILGTGEVETRGVRRGYITDLPTATLSIRSAIARAEQGAGEKIRRAVVGVGGATLRGEVASGVAIVSKADGEVTALDLEKAAAECEENFDAGNKKIVRSIPLSFKLDGREVLGRPEGMRGTRLEVKNFFITSSLLHFEDLMQAVAEAGVEPVDAVPLPLSGGKIVLSEREMMLGGAVLDIGAETTHLAVYENGLPSSLQTFSIGGSDITNDIALGLKISLEEAERLKLGQTSENFSKKKLEEIIEARLSDIFELADGHLRRIRRSELLPAGVVIIGGSSGIPSIDELARLAMKLPARVGTTEMFGSLRTKLRDPSWFGALGLLLSAEETGSHRPGSFKTLWRNFKNLAKSNIRELLP